MAREEEFVEFAQASSRRLVHAAYLMTGDRHRAEDAAQTALTRAYANWSRVRRQDAFAYARTTMVNHLVDGWRRPIRELSTAELPDRVQSADVADAVIQRRWLLAAIRELSPNERAIVVLRYFFDLPEQEVAREMNVTVGTVKSTHARALAKLRISTDPPGPPSGGGCTERSARSVRVMIGAYGRTLSTG